MKFSVEKLGEALESACPEVVFAMLHGSARDGCVADGSDVDVALFLDGDGTQKASLDLFMRAQEAVASVVPHAPADIGILNGTEPVYRFEALKGKLLFTRDEETSVGFFSLTCREYESQMASYERQRKYRIEAATGG